MMSSASEPFLRVNDAVVRFGSSVVLDGVDISVEKGEFVSILGPSGCGKTTLLRLIAGLVRSDKGTVTLGAQNLTVLAAHRRNIGVVFQNYALFPHLRVADNVAFGLRARKVPKNEIAQIVSSNLEMVRMADFADRTIQSLSGGQQQRVAVARALAVRPALLLFDEPFSALDRKLRESMQIELRSLLRMMATTAIFVTHDQEEALIMSDRVAVMNSGKIEQFGSPAVVYDKPATPFVLEFVGLSSRLSGLVISDDDGVIEIKTGMGRVRARANLRPGSEVIVGVRPERMTIGPSADAADNQITARLADAVYSGARTQVHFAAPTGDRILVETDRNIADAMQVGADLRVGWSIADTLIFPRQSLPAP